MKGIMISTALTKQKYDILNSVGTKLLSKYEKEPHKMLNHLCDELKKHNYVYSKLQYAGSGDEGHMYDWYLYGEITTDKRTGEIIYKEDYDFSQIGYQDEHTIKIPNSLYNCFVVIEDYLLYMYVNKEDGYFDGLVTHDWYNNEGGGGTLKIDFKRKKITSRTYQYFIKEEDYADEYFQITQDTLKGVHYESV